MLASGTYGLERVQLAEPGVHELAGLEDVAHAVHLARVDREHLAQVLADGGQRGADRGRDVGHDELVHQPGVVRLKRQVKLVSPCQKKRCHRHYSRC